ncbi:CAP domain-containing protein [Lentibacillus salinarum]|uniref:CAP domain-containing protein n=1 Tax=Lentibacillus salinarum TaxID=446820 RepID=A0ABW3ZYM9_9BACI
MVASFDSAGENNDRQVVEAWMDNEEQRENILNESFTHIGVSYNDSGRYGSQMFIVQ